MTLYVLDTNVLVDFQAGHNTVCSRVLACPIDQLATTVISVEEQLSGWYTLLRRAKSNTKLSRAYQRLSENVKLLAHFQLLNFDESAIERFVQLKKLRLGVKHMDLRIAAIVLESHGVLVTRNEVDFNQIPDLTVENWHD